MEYKPTVVFDFDGVVHSYVSGWDKINGAASILDGPVDGIKEIFEELRQDYKIVIVSTRCANINGMEAISQWLIKYGIVVDNICATKPPAIVYVDDRAICFNGKTEGLIEQIKTFKNWLGK